MKSKLLLRIFAVVSALAGLGFLVSVVYPIVSYEINKKDRFSAYLSATPTPVDFTKASNWFPTLDTPFVPNNVTFYTISVPKLNIENATVAIGGEDLSESLIQYPGTAMPGKRGNAVIFGHSILPQFYNPKDYISIFSKLPDLRRGDEVHIVYDGVSYKFRIEESVEVEPTDTEVLEQNLSDAFVTLVTCVPPGDPRRPRRLVVKARIIPLTGYNTQYENLGN